MKEKYGLFGLLTIILMAAVSIAVGVSILVENSPLGERLDLLGVWVIASFFIMVGLAGNARGVRRVDIKVPWKLAIIAFVLAGALFVAGNMVS